MSHPLPWSRAAAALLAVTVACGTGTGLGLSTGTGPITATARPATTTTVESPHPDDDGTTTTTQAPQWRSYVAHTRPELATIDIYDTPGGAVTHSLANPNEHGVEVVFLTRTRDVEAGAHTWHEVYLPVRPNGTTGWVRAEDVTIAYLDQRVVVELGAHRLTVYRQGQPEAVYPVAVGTTDTPTPGGIFYIKELLGPLPAGSPYGEYAYGLSGYSNSLDSFNGGAAVIGIHGTNDPASIGSDVSHGCIRMHNEHLRELIEELSLGTPVEILP